ncbi:MAG: hypothetical protein AAFP77_30940 [Bacteroidota bacterium]
MLVLKALYPVMRFIKLSFHFALIFTFLCSCEEQGVVEVEESLSGVNLRIENATTIALDSIISNDHYFGALESGEVSDYVRFEQIYQWPNVSCSDGERGYFWDSPVDGIGYWISFYKEGDYTLVITGIAVTSPVLVEAHIQED